MKKVVYIICLLLTIVSCTNDELDMKNQSLHYIRLEYVPKGIPEEITLSNGEKIYMDIDSTYYKGDIIFSKEQVDLMTRPTTRSAVIKSRIHYWPNKSIPYKINSGFSTDEIMKIQDALQSISNYTGIQFTETNTPPAKHIEFVPTPDSWSSPVGMQSNGNTIRIGTNEYYIGVILHEIMHSLGFFHEHQRTDRDTYVNIYPDNIDPVAITSFNKYTDSGYQGYDIGTFDYNSVLLYHSRIFAIIDTCYTITDNNGGILYQNKGNLSNGDIKGLKFVYGPERLVLDTEVIYDYVSGDDEYYIYSNTVRFVDSSNNPVVLDHPRLIVVDYSEYQFGDGPGMSTNNTTTEYYIAPSGVSSYSLGVTEYLHEEEGYGIIRRHEESWYNVYSY